MLAEGHGNHFEVLERVIYPHSLGIFYTAVTQWLGFPEYGDEGKVMGLAPYGDAAAYLAKMRDLVQLDGPTFRARARLLHARQGRRRHELGRRVSDDRAHLLRAARRALRPGPRAGRRDHRGLHRTSPHRSRRCSRRPTSTSCDTLWERTSIPNLCLAGGVALNAVANGRILPETPFEQLYVQPAAGDSGTAVGAAYYVWNQVLGQPRGFVMEHAYTGPEFSDEEIRAALDAGGRRRASGSTTTRSSRRGRAHRRGRRRRLVPGPHGVRPARARAPVDRRRPTPRRR